MIFNSILIYFLLFVNQTLGILDILSNVNNECSVRLETDEGIQTCFNQQCSDYKNPWRILYIHNQDRPCYLHYLKLSFTTYDQLLVFVELQATNNRSLGQFFDDRQTELRVLEIEIDTIYPFNPGYFLSENMLNKLGGSEENIDILVIDMKRWYRSIRSIIQVIEGDLIRKQPFEQILIIYPCNTNNRTIHRIYLAKSIRSQERSTCPTQIRVLPYFGPLKTTNQINTSMDFISHKQKNPHRSSLISKILIALILIIIVVIYLIYQLIYNRL